MEEVKSDSFNSSVDFYSTHAMPDDDQAPFPWHLGVFDAHCHPTDTLKSLGEIPAMKTRVLTVMATRYQDQDLVANAASAHPFDTEQLAASGQTSHRASILPSYGWHPWFSHHLFNSALYSDNETLSSDQKEKHYGSVLTPAPDTEFIASLPSPISMDSHLASCRGNLVTHSHALVGEIGLDRAFRLPSPWTEDAVAERDSGLTPGGREGRRLSPYRVSLDHQRYVLQAQLRLAGELKRAVSVHGVQCHGLLYDALAATWKEGLSPDRICLHSYSGPAEGVKRYVQRGVPSKVYFSFSVAVNWSPTPGRTEEVVRAVPDDRVLVESDLHVAGSRMDEMLEEVVRRICALKEWELEAGVRRLAQNYREFVVGK